MGVWPPAGRYASNGQSRGNGRALENGRHGEGQSHPAAGIGSFWAILDILNGGLIMFEPTSLRI